MITDMLNPGLARRIDKMMKAMCRAMHYALFIMFFCIIGALVYSGLKLLYNMNELSTKIIITAIGVWLAFNVIFNYLMVCCVGPGNPELLPKYLL